MSTPFGGPFVGSRYGFSLGNLFDVNRIYSAQRGAASGIGVGGLLGAVAGFAFASNPIAGLAMAATGALGGAAVGGLFGLSHPYF